MLHKVENSVEELRIPENLCKALILIIIPIQGDLFLQVSEQELVFGLTDNTQPFMIFLVVVVGVKVVVEVPVIRAGEVIIDHIHQSHPQIQRVLVLKLAIGQVKIGLVGVCEQHNYS